MTTDKQRTKLRDEFMEDLKPFLPETGRLPATVQWAQVYVAWRAMKAQELLALHTAQSDTERMAKVLERLADAVADLTPP